MSVQIRFQRAMDLFEAICDLPVDQRITALNERCGNDHELRSDVERLLRHDAAPLDLLSQRGAVAGIELLAADLASDELDVDEPAFDEDIIPVQLGEFRILRKIGEGGMGKVYLAQQDKPQRTVALKVIRSELTSNSAARRFEHEAHVLGLLTHPGIARIYQAGSAVQVMPDGQSSGKPQSFFAMEYIDGLPITQFAAVHRLTTRQRLDLMMQVCRAVEYAHQKGVIHRDLKPSNILVSQGIHETAQSSQVSFVQSRSVPKILDFGVARLTDADLQITTIQTDIGQLIGTLQYMSPEQVSADPSELDTRSDVYALGMILYELLAGRLPYDLRQKPVHEATRIIREVEPVSLSTADRRLRGDIETIALKALDKEKDHRYQSAAELAEDIRRYLADQPIAARPHSRMYYLRKFARRNKVLVGGAAAVVMALVAGFIGTTLGMMEARRQRDDAQHQTKITQAINDFVNDDLLSQADPSHQANRDLSLRQALDNAAAGIEGRFADEPRVEAGIRATLGDTYAGLGEYELAMPHLQRVVVIREQTLGPAQRETLQAKISLANAFRHTANDAQAEDLYRQALTADPRQFAPDDEIIQKAKEGIGLLRDQQSRFDEAEQLFTEVLATRERTLGEEHKQTLHALNNLAMIYEKQGKLDQAEALHVRELTICQKHFGDEHPETLTSMANLAVVYQSQGRFDEAESIQVRVLEISRRVLKPDHPSTILAMNNLASTLIGQKRLNDAEPLLVQCFEANRRKFGEAHPDTLAAMNNLANVYYGTKRFDEAASMANRALSAARELYGEDHLEVALAKGTLANIYRWQKQFAEAETMATQTYDWMSSHFAPNHQYVRQSIEIVARVYDQWGKPELAASWRAKATAAESATQPR